MTITPGLMYWFTRLDGIQNLAIITLLLAVIGAFGLLVFWAYIDDLKNNQFPQEDIKSAMRLHKCLRRLLYVIVAASTSILVFVPTQKEMAAIYIVPAVVNNEHVIETAKSIPEVAALGMEWLKETITDTIKPRGKDAE